MIFNLFSNPPTIVPGIMVSTAESIMSVLAFIAAIALALGVHEFGHAFVAHKCGDDTAKNFGRMTINPVRHLDNIGFLMLLLVGFGWAKPVPVNSSNFRNYKRDNVLVSLAGVLCNLVTAFFVYGLYMFLLSAPASSSLWDNRFLYLLFYLLVLSLGYYSLLSVALTLFNILPLFPLDGYRVLETYLGTQNKAMIFLRQYSFMILIGLLLLGSVFPAFSPLVWFIEGGRDLILGLFESFWGLFGL